MISYKGSEFFHKLAFSNTSIFSTQFRRRYIFQTMNSVRSNSLSLKYQGFPPLGCQDIRIRKFEFVAKTQFLCELVTPPVFILSHKY